MNLYVGYDIGGTSIKSAIIDQKRTILYQDSVATYGLHDPLHTIKALMEQTKTFIAERKGSLTAIGIGCTGPVNRKTGAIHNPYTLPGYEGVNIKTMMETEFEVPVICENDANAAHVGEASMMDPAVPNSIMITFGTGIGVSVRLGGKLFRLPGPFHPEIGHISVGVGSPDLCYCNKSHCFEHVMSGSGINRYAMDTYGQSPEEVLKNPDSEQYRKFLARMVDATTEAIITLSILFNPEVVFIGGGMHLFICRYVMGPVQERLDTLLPVYGKTVLKDSQIGPLAGCYGAAMLATGQSG
ncbi:ROK family protein [Sphaerochaeta sp. PS]|uniref:ROK family protein n=1 Tax=Sphaerochaeta sp. PS TaxID=3076336 RepID=UPI0028A552E5|nr:ROK family protein [Sphaerochaeta sp. PS]MDT4763187.1 ROK family protein [Sphaerochaeta sp. PS]